MRNQLNTARGAADLRTSPTALSPIEYGYDSTGRVACYALHSFNTTSSVNSVTFYDEDFCSISGRRIGAGNTYANVDNATWGQSTYGGGNMQGQDYLSSTTNNTANSATTTYIQGTNAAGEIGNSLMDTFSDGSFFGTRLRQGGSWNYKYYINKNVIGSQHLDKSYVYMIYGGMLRAVSRCIGSFSYGKEGTQEWSTPSGVAGGFWNRKRRELTLMAYTSGNTLFTVYTYSGVDFDRFPSPAEAMNRPEVSMTQSTVTITASNGGNSSVSDFELAVADSGTCWYVNFIESSSLRVSSWKRSGTATVTAAYLSALSTSTAYGIDQGIHYRTVSVMSRDGSAIAVGCPYYYYGSGIECFMIDLVGDGYTQYQNGGTSNGIQLLPYKDSGFAFYFAGNAYSSNCTGGYIDATFNRIKPAAKTLPTDGCKLQQTSGQICLPYFPQPNTTNYPGMTQVVDYAMLTRDAVSGELLSTYGWKE